MTFNAIVWKMFKVNFKRYLLYFACNVFAVMFLLLFYSIYYNDEIERMKRTDSFDTVLAIPTAALILFMFFFIQYAHQMFIKHRKSEFGIFMAIGMSPKNIARLLITESLFISILALCLGLISGTLLSKLFFLTFSYFTNLSPGFFHISLKMITYTILVYVLLFWFATIFSTFQIRNQSLLTSIQSKQMIDFTKTNRSTFGFIGLTFITISIIGLYWTYKNHEDLMFIWAMLTFTGLYLFLSNATHTAINLIKGQPTFYFRSILLFSSLNQKQKKLTSLLTLTSIMIMITTLYCTITIVIADDEYKDMLANNPSDIAYVEYEQYNSISNDELLTLFERENSPITDIKTIPFFEISKDDYYYGEIVYNVISINDYNHLMNKNIKLEKNEYILFINRLQEYMGDEDWASAFELEQYDLSLKATKIDQLLTYVGSSNTFIILNQTLWENFITDRNINQYVQKHIQVTDWKNSLPAVQTLKETFSKNNPVLKSSTEDMFQISSKIEDYTIKKEHNAVLFYLLSFLSVLFYFGVFILLYLNLMSDIDLEKSKFEKLHKIGITKKELNHQLSSETAILFFLPTFLGITLAFIYIVGMSQKDGGLANNLMILLYFLITSLIYFLIQFSFFLYAKSKLFKKVWNYLSSN